MLFNDRRAVKSALKAANRPSRAPKGYKPDTAGRKEVEANVKGMYTLGIEGTRKQNYDSSSMRVENRERKEKGQGLKYYRGQGIGR